MRIVEGFLDGARVWPSPDHGGAIRPELIVIHYTGAGQAEGSVGWLATPDDVYVSAHCVIDRDGTVFQLVPFGTRAFHAGKSEYLRKGDVNRFSVGLELANWGRLEGRRGVYWSRSRTPVEVMDVQVVDGVGWERFPAAQLDSAVEVCRALGELYPIRGVVGHSEVAIPKGRKEDPGPAFPMQEFRTRVVEVR
jgi:N-acetylmuramoyl-L-alanine amidase